MSQDAPPKLDYASPPPSDNKQRVMKWVALSFVLLVLFGLLAGIGREILGSAREHYRRQQSQALLAPGNQYTPPPDQIVWEEDPQKTATLLQDSAHYQLANYSPPVPALRKLPAELGFLNNNPSFLGFDPKQAALFVHERTNPGKNGWLAEKQLLIVTLQSTRGGYIEPNNLWTVQALCVLIGPDGNLESRPWGVVQIPVAGELNDLQHTTRFYAGQPDPADPSHFTIGYAVDGVPGILDGWLSDGGPPRFQVRTGPATRASN